MDRVKKRGEKQKKEGKMRRECNGTLDKTRRGHEHAFASIESTRRVLWLLVDDRVRVPAFVIDLRCRSKECARPYRSASNERLFVTRSILLSFVR